MNTMTNAPATPDALRRAFLELLSRRPGIQHDAAADARALIRLRTQMTRKADRARALLAEILADGYEPAAMAEAFEGLLRYDDGRLSAVDDRKPERSAALSALLRYASKRQRRPR